MINEIFDNIKRILKNEKGEAVVESFKRKNNLFFDDSNNPSNTLEKASETPKFLPYIPLKRMVFFEDMQFPLHIKEKTEIVTIERAFKLSLPIVLSSQKDSQKTYLDLSSDVYDIGVLATIVSLSYNSDGSLRVEISSFSRVLIQEIISGNEWYEASFEESPLVQGEDPLRLEAARRVISKSFSQYLGTLKFVSDELYSVLESLDSLRKFIGLLANSLPSKVEYKQKILEENSLEKRLLLIGGILERENNIHKISEEISQKATHKIKDAEKEYMLKEQLRAIKSELGDKEGSDDTEYLLKLIKKNKLPKEAASQAKEEIERLEKIPSFSPESGMIRSYVDFLLHLPWYKKTSKNFTLDEVKDTLDKRHYGLEKVKERIVEYFAVRKLAPKSKSPILCFVGPPGTGKTSLATSVADALGRKFLRISLGGVRDEAEIRGHRRTYLGALPGRIIKGMKTLEVVNPVILLDEIDKMDNDLRGDPTAALLEVLDPEQNHAFVDHFLEVPYDLSEVMFITTANMLYTIPEPLRDRLEIIELSSYTEDEKVHIATEHLLPNLIKDHGLIKKREPQFSEKILRQIIRSYTKEAGVRRLEKALAKICRKIATDIVKSSSKKPIPPTYRLTNPLIKKFLGSPRFQTEEKEKTSQIGIVTGLAWTEVGGVIMPIEVVVMDGKGKLIITGQLGDVMQESAKAALSFIRSRAHLFGLSKNFQEKIDIHIHVPEGAVPKDGPSAGIAIASALISALTKKAISPDLAMTGEITLRGRVLPIGGLKEKVIAAHRAGIKEVLIPQKNNVDLENIPREILGEVNITEVATMEEVFSKVLSLSPKRQRK